MAPSAGGKTATAFELHRRLPGSVVCDPEHLGFGLHRMLPPALRADFQDLAAWRSGTHEILDLVAHGHEGPVIIPMTLVNPRYFAQVVGRLRADGAAPAPACTSEPGLTRPHRYGPTLANDREDFSFDEDFSCK